MTARENLFARALRMSERDNFSLIRKARAKNNHNSRGHIQLQIAIFANHYKLPLGLSGSSLSTQREIQDE
jgi:hypothetical protein